VWQKSIFLNSILAISGTFNIIHEYFYSLTHSFISVCLYLNVLWIHVPVNHRNCSCSLFQVKKPSILCCPPTQWSLGFSSLTESRWNYFCCCSEFPHSQLGWFTVGLTESCSTGTSLSGGRDSSAFNDEETPWGWVGMLELFFGGCWCNCKAQAVIFTEWIIIQSSASQYESSRGPSALSVPLLTR